MNNEIENKSTSIDMSNEELNKRLNEAQVKYPVWTPGKPGAIIAGKIVEVKNFPFMHNKHGAVMAVIDTGTSEEPNVAYWLNTVAQSQLLKLYNEDLPKGENPVPQEADFESRVDAIRGLVGTDVIIRYDGEEKSKDKSKKNLNPYQKYTIVRR